MRRRAATPIVAVLAAALGACVPASPGTGGPSASTTDPGSAGSGSDVVPTQASGTPATDGFDAAVTGVVRRSEDSGGTLRLAASSECASWDPARVSTVWCADLQRLLTRTLVGYASGTAAEGTALVPDLAEALGQVSSDLRTWTYRLREGVRWQDGTPVTSRDVRYGIERLFAVDDLPGVQGGPLRPLLDDCSAPAGCRYAGPYAAAPLGLASIATPDDRTIVFTLTRPYASLDSLLALPATSPVPRAKDLGARYGDAVYATGPFQVDQAGSGRRLTVLVRNPRWDPATDPIRRPLAERVEVSVLPDVVAVDRALAAGEADLAADGRIGAGFSATVLGSHLLRQRADAPATGTTLVLVVLRDVAPLARRACREAVDLALDRRAVRDAAGGPVLGGQATSILTPPTLPAGAEPATAATVLRADGDPAAARDRLAACRSPEGFGVRLAHPDDDSSAAVAAAVARGLGRVGIRVRPVPYPQAGYATTVLGSPATLRRDRIGLALAEVSPALPTTYGLWHPLTGEVTPVGNTNVALLRDPAVDALVSSPSAASPDPVTQVVAGSGVEAAVAAHVVYLPLLYRTRLAYRGPRTTNVTVTGAFANLYDYVNVGVSDG